MLLLLLTNIETQPAFQVMYGMFYTYIVHIIRYVDASPEWAKQLEADLPSGKTTVTFMARSPLTDDSATCSFTVEVVGKSPLLVV